MVGKIPFDPVLTKAMAQGQTVLEYEGDSEAGKSVKEIWNNLLKFIEA
jgi:MinD-like ATPase involved in chromosome partitioning or flagellar assembly